MPDRDSRHSIGTDSSDGHRHGRRSASGRIVGAGAGNRAGQRDPDRGRRPFPFLGLVTVALGAACLVVWFATPAFLLPEPIPGPEPERIEAGLRMEMAAVVSRVEAYREDTGRTPRAPDEVPVDPPRGVEYDRLSASEYRLRGERRGIEVVFDSGTPTDVLLDGARRRIEAGWGASS